jgi:dTDP-4-dehydrorhamnose reductase
MRVLVTGGAGQVGLALARHPWPAGVVCEALDRHGLDVTDAASIAAALAGGPYAAVINCAAYTAVDKAESEVEAAWRLNALGPALLAQATAAAGIPLVQVSTDYVFDGAKAGAYAPDDPIAPASVYGASKAAGELAVRASNPRHAIVRTAWVVSPDRANFVKTMLRLSAERDGLKVVDDQRGSPTIAADLAAALAAVALGLAGGGERGKGEAGEGETGTFHCANAGETTWCGFARAIVAGSAARGGRLVPVEGIPSSAYPTPARRPANSVLATGTLARAYGVVMRPWEAALDDVLDALVGPRVGGPKRDGGA